MPKTHKPQTSTTDTRAADIAERVHSYGLVPVVVLHDASDAAPLAAALRDGGLPCAEVTFRTPTAAAAIKIMAEDPDLLLGAGTVLTPWQVEEAVAAGATYIVSPGFSGSVAAACRQLGVPLVPGVATATEIQMGLDAGLDVLKFFPAETSGGVSALKALAAPFGAVRFLPTGGISTTNAMDYLRMDAVLAVGGSWMVAPDLVYAGRFDEVARLTREAVALVDAVRAPASRHAS
jgi:2-dehydro-3-deoxyphosphogluconate aldolase / (4S)-4-hydroxy-2-oxoglutarate aldolase